MHMVLFTTKDVLEVAIESCSGIRTHDHWILLRCSNQLKSQAVSLTFDLSWLKVNFCIAAAV